VSLFEAILLGFIQGVAEFLPISSDGHLALAALLFDVKEGGLTLTVMLHVGTLLATALVLRQRLGTAIAEGARALGNPEIFSTTPGGRDALFVVGASVPTALIGLGLRDAVEVWTYSPWAIGFGFLATTLCLVVSVWAKPGLLESPGVRAALLVGVFQGLAVLPGVSRSALTITTLFFLGVQRGRAFELSMLMSIPAVFGAVLLESPHAVRDIQGVGMAVLGTVVAFVTGVIALLLLRSIVVSGRFAWFALWVGPLALATLALARSLPP